MKRLIIAAVLALASATAQAQEPKWIYQQGTPNQHNAVRGMMVGTMPAVGLKRARLFAPFTVSSPAVLGGVVLPISGEGLIVELGTGRKAVRTDLDHPQVVAPPKILARAPVQGQGSASADTTVPIPGGVELVPGQQYFLILTAADLDKFAGGWRTDENVLSAAGVVREDGSWYLERGNRPGGPPFALYAAP